MNVYRHHLANPPGAVTFLPPPFVNQRNMHERKQNVSEQYPVANSPDDLSLFIHPRLKNAKQKQVYDVTPYLGRHPGGDAMLRPAGGDATEGFYGPQHPVQAKEILDRYYIGMLKTT